MGEHKPFKLLPHQLEGIEFISKSKRGIIVGDDMGTGKTLQSLAFTKWSHYQEGLERVLVVCPAALLCQWDEEIEKYYGFKPAVYKSGKPILDNFVTLISMETLRTQAKGVYTHVHRLNHHFTGKKYTIILDEAHEACNPDSHTNISIRALSPPHRIIPMTGTPIKNKVENLYGIVLLLDPWLDKAEWYNRYIIRELKNVPTKRGVRTVWNITGYKNLDHLNAYLQTIMIRRLKGEVNDLPPKRVQYVPYYPDRRYEGFLYDIDLSDEPVMVKVVRLIEAASGLNPFDKSKEDFIPGNKYQLLKQLIGSTDGRMIVFFQYYEVLRHVKALLSKAGYNVYEWSGRNHTTRTQQVRDWAVSESGILLGTIDAAGLGLNLVEGTTAIFYEPCLSPSGLQQAEDRIYRVGQTKPVNIFYLYGRETVEEAVMALLRRKKATTDAVVGGNFTSEELQQIYKYSYRLEYRL